MDGHGLRRRAVDLLIDDLGRVCYDLRRYLDEGETPIRKVKPPDVKAARDLFEQIITRIGHVSTKLADEQFLSSGILPEPLANGPHTPISNVDVSTIVHHQQQFVPTESVEPNQPPQQVQLEREPVQQQVQPQPEQSAQQREQPQAQQEVHLQPKLLPQQHGQQHDVWQHYQQHAQQSQLQGQQRDQLQSRHEVQLLPKLQPQQRDQQQIKQAALLQVQQENQLQPQQPVQQQVQLLLQQRDQHQGQQEVQLQPQQPLQQYNQLPDDLEDRLQGRQEPQQAVSQQEQLDGQRRILPQNQQQGQQQDQQQDQQRAQLQSQEKAHLQHQQRDQQHGKQIQQDQQNQFQYQQQENQHTEAVLEAAPECAPEAIQEAVPETVPETVADAGAGAVDREASSQPEPPAQDEIHVVGPGPRAASPTPTIHNIPTNSSTSCDTDHDVEVRPEDPVQLPPPKLLPLPKDSAPLFDCTYQDVHVLNEELFEQCSLHPDVQDRGYFKLQVRDLPPLQVGKMAKPDQTHATSFVYKKDNVGLVKVDTGKRPRMKWPEFPLTPTEKQNWSLREQKHLWNSTAAHPPSGAQPYIIGNPLFDDVELSPGDKLRRRGQTVLEGINTQYMYFNLKAKTITVMHREDAHVRSENLLRDGENKFWCFVKPSSAAKLEERMRHDFPEMRSCSQAVRHLSRHIPPAKLDEWGVEYTLDYCVPGQAVVTEPGTYHQVLNLGPNYAIAINVEYESSPDDPPNYTYCDEACPDQCAISAEDFRINPNATAMDRLALPAKTKPMAMMAQPKKSGAVSPGRHLLTNSIPTDSAPTSDQQREEQHPGSGPMQQQLEDAENYHYRQPESAVPPSIPSTVSNISEVNPSVIDSGRVEGGPMQVVSEPQQVITQSEAPPEVQQAVVEVRHVAQKPEAPVEVHQATPEQEEIALLPAQPPSQPVMVEQQEEQTAMVRPEPAILNSVQAHGLDRSVAYHQQELPIIQATFPMLQQSTTSPLVATGPAPLFKIPDVRFVGPPVLQPFDGAIRTFDREFEMQTFNAQQPEYGILQTPPALKQSNFPAQIIGSYVRPNSSDSPYMLNNAASSAVGIKRHAEIQMQSAVKRTKPDNEETSFEHLADLLRTAKSPPVEQVWSKAAFSRLAGLVRDWREYSRLVSIPGGGFDLFDHIDDAEQISQELHIFLRRFFKMKLSEGVHSTAQVNGLKDVSDRPVSSHIDWGELSRKLNWDVAGRNQLNDYVREGKCWRTICGEYDGLLCLLPSDDRFLELSMFKEQLAHFHAQLSTNAVRRMCAMGQILEKSIWEYLELPEFAWESVDTSELSLDDISPLLSQFKLIKANQYNRLKYKWELQPQPLGWTDPWPSDPMSVLRSDKKVCSLCNSSKRMTTEKSSCKCLVKRLPQIPRITEDGSRGPGVRAVGSFKAGEFLGELVGELRPPQRSGAPDSSNRHHSNIPNGHTPLDNHDSKRHNYEWTMEVRRPDLNDQVVAEIYPQQMGNWVRKVRHDGVNPSAIYNVMKITGKWRVMLVALRDIRDGEEITAKYGRGYRKEQPYEVVEGLH